MSCLCTVYNFLEELMIAGTIGMTGQYKNVQNLYPGIIGQALRKYNSTIVREAYVGKKNHSNRNRC